jgi:hypothetical protein
MLSDHGCKEPKFKGLTLAGEWRLPSYAHGSAERERTAGRIPTVGVWVFIGHGGTAVLHCASTAREYSGNLAAALAVCLNPQRE